MKRISFLGALAILFIALKLCNIIDWSWWWVTCPLWGGFAVWTIMAITMALLYVSILLIRYIKTIRNK